MKTAFLYAGQGSQHVGMGADLYRDYPEFRRVFDSVSDALQQYTKSEDFRKEFAGGEGVDPNYDLHSLVFQDPDAVINETRYTQPAMVAFACGVTEILRVHGIRPDVTAGLSLGEYSALEAAEVMDAETTVNMVAFRGASMAAASEGIDCGMSAVLGVSAEDLETVCRQAQLETGKIVSLCNLNCPGQIVIGGEKAAVAKASEIISASGKGKCIPLRVSGPFHTVFMKSAGDALARYFKNIRFQRPKCPVMFNYLGGACEEVSASVESTTATTLAGLRKAIPELLEEQVQKPVRMEAILREMFEDGVTNFIEIGPGHTLAGFVKKVARDMGITEFTVTAIETSEDIAKLCAEA